jgi:hypothetical protein
MSKEKSSPPEPSVPLSAKRRPARSRSGKPAKQATTPQSVPEDSHVEKSASGYPVFDLAESPAGNGISEAAASDESSPQEGVKRSKRRRKKGKGGSASQAITGAASSESLGEVAATHPRPAQQARVKLDPESVSKLALKIYLSEVSEEGVALISDSDAKELTHRCFRLAEIFMEEQARRR